MPGEQQYLHLLLEAIVQGVYRADRTGVGCRSLFGAQMRFDLGDDLLPIITTKRMFVRGIIEELIWFLSGSTDARRLDVRGVKIWNGNSSRGFLDAGGFTDYKVGDCGPIYGYQWRNFGDPEYTGKTSDESENPYPNGRGVDQIRRLCDGIRKDPNGRRHIISAWNPAQIDMCPLPPCHILAQFHVVEKELICNLYQRSGDLFLGVPFNITSYSLLTHMVAECCGLKARWLIHTIGDAHIYENHIDAAKIQLAREPLPFPHVELSNGVEYPFGYSVDDIKIDGYRCHKAIKADMAV